MGVGVVADVVAGVVALFGCFLVVLGVCVAERLVVVVVRVVFVVVDSVARRCFLWVLGLMCCLEDCVVVIVPL